MLGSSLLYGLLSYLKILPQNALQPGQYDRAARVGNLFLALVTGLSSLITVGTALERAFRSREVQERRYREWQAMKAEMERSRRKKQLPWWRRVGRWTSTS